jgi:hypothetical protein
MVQVDVPAAFGIGSFFADVASRQLRFGRPEYYYRAVWKNNIFQIFFFSWIPIYFLLNYFGWETTHMWWDGDSVAAYPYYVPLFIVIFFAAANAGFLLGKWLITRGHVVANRVMYLIVGVYCLIWVFGQTNRTFDVATPAQWEQGIRVLFYQDPVFLRMFIFSMVVWIAGLLAFALSLWREGKHLDYVDTASTP